jgi:hypothetical protein
MIQKRYFTVLAVFILVIPAYADQIVKPTSAGTINVGFTTDPATPNLGDQTQIKISFINKQTNILQPHVDYKISVMQGANQVFGIPITHTTAGAVIIPFQFQTSGHYQVIVDVEGLVFQPIPPETATFDLNVGGSSTSSNQINPVPEFPASLLILIIAMVSFIFIFRIVKSKVPNLQISDDEFVKQVWYRQAKNNHHPSHIAGQNPCNNSGMGFI